MKLIDTDNERVKEVVVRKNALSNLNESIDRTLFLVCEGINYGKYTLVEGNRRAIALMDLGQLIGLTVYLGIYKNRNGFIPPKMG